MIVYVLTLISAYLNHDQSRLTSGISTNWQKDPTAGPIGLLRTPLTISKSNELPMLTVLRMIMKPMTPLKIIFMDLSD